MAVHTKCVAVHSKRHIHIFIYNEESIYCNIYFTLIVGQQTGCPDDN